MSIFLIPSSFANDDIIFNETDNIDENNDFVSNDNVFFENIVNNTVLSDEDILTDNIVMNSDNSNEDSIIANDLVLYYHNGSSLKAIFYDNNHNLLINEKVEFYINDVAYSRTTNYKGVASVTINLNPGIYLVSIFNTVTNFYKIVNVNVLSTLQGSDVVKYYKNSTKYSVKVLDGVGNSFSGANISLNINGVFYNRISDSDGFAYLSINLGPGNYIVTVTHPNGQLWSNNIIVLSTLESSDIGMISSDRYNYHVKVLNHQGNPLSGESITMNINGVFYNRISDSDGFAYLSINLGLGEYIITASRSNGDALSTKIFVYPGINEHLNNVFITPVSSHVKKGDKYIVKLTEDNGLPLKNKQIKFNVNNNVYYGTTDTQGYASFIANLDLGSYSVTSTYGSYSVTRNLIINDYNGIDTLLTPLTSALWTGNSFKVKLTNKHTGEALINQKVSLYVNGVEYNRTTNSEGIASLKINFNIYKVYTMSLNFAGSNVYQSTSTYKLFYVANNKTDEIYYDVHISPSGYIVKKNDWIDTKNILIDLNCPLENVISDINSSFMICLEKCLSKYDDILENMISINTYVSSINFENYFNNQYSAINVVSNFRGNCVDQTNVFVSLLRISKISSRYVLGSVNSDSHMWGQFLIDNIWVCVDNSATDSNLINYEGNRFIGNKDYLNIFNIETYVFEFYTSDEMAGIIY